MPIDISGLKTTIAGLEQFKKATGRRVLERALIRAAQPIVDAAKTAAPVKTGRLRSGIKAFVLRSSPGKAAYASAKGSGASDEDAALAARAANRAAAGAGLSATVRVAALPFYGKFVELGTQHAPAHPFLGPAFRSQRDAVLSTINQDLQTEIAASVARIAARKSKASP